MSLEQYQPDESSIVSTVLHLICRSAIMDAERLEVLRLLQGAQRAATIVEDAIIRKANRILAVKTIQYKHRSK